VSSPKKFRFQRRRGKKSPRVHTQVADVTLPLKTDAIVLGMIRSRHPRRSRELIISVLNDYLPTVKPLKRRKLLERWRICQKPGSKLPYPRQPSEADIVFYLAKNIEQAGFDVRLEVSVRRDDTTHRFDLVVYDEHVAILLIEVKKHAHGAVRSWKGQERPVIAPGALEKQLEKYSCFRVPIDVVCGMKAAKQYVSGKLFAPYNRSTKKLWRII